MKLTRKAIDSFPIPKKGQRFYSDSEIKGFGINVFSTGAKSFYYQYGRSYNRKKIVIGKYGTITLEQARDKARELASSVLNKRDPLEEKKSDQISLTLGQWIDQYIEIVEARNKPTSVLNDKLFLSCKNPNSNNKRGANKLKRDYIPSEWKKKPITAITTNDIGRRLELITKNVSPVSGNRWLASIRACLQEAWRRELIEVNPAMRVRANSVTSERDRVLTDEEYIRFRNAIDQIESVSSRAIFILLTETGARLSEVLNAKWKDIRFDLDRWILPDTKSNRKQHIPLNDSLVKVLKSIPREGEYLISGREKGSKRKDVKRTFSKILKISGIEDFHIHDIRRTFCVQIIKVAGVNVASKLLRHSDIRVTTKHYSPEGDEALINSMNKRAELLPFKKTGSEK